MHTIKRNSLMMPFDNISTLAHSAEGLFDYIRENLLSNIEYSIITDLLPQSMDFIKDEASKTEDDKELDGDTIDLIYKIKE